MKQMKLFVVGAAFCLLCFPVTLAFAASVNDPVTSTGGIAYDENAAVTPVNPDSPETTLQIEGTGQKGPLTLDYVPKNISFGTTNTNAGHASAFRHLVTNMTPTSGDYNAPFIQVSDFRTNRAGWAVTVKATAFTNQDATKTINGAVLEIATGSINASNEYKTASKAAVPVANSATVNCSPDSQPVVVFSAAGSSSDLVGTWVDRMYDPVAVNAGAVGATTPLPNTGITLKVPVGQTEAKTSYTNTITWALYNTPTGQ